MAARRSTVAPQTNPALNALLSFSGSLTRTKQGGVFSEALSAVFEGTGLHDGVVHEATPTGLELVAEEGLPVALRTLIGSFPVADAPWFAIQQAAKRRRIVVEENVPASLAAHAVTAAPDSAGWDAVAAAPILIGRDVLGVLTLGAPSADAFTPNVLAVLEVVANMLALSLARERAMSGEHPPSTMKPAQVTAVDQKLTRLATLGSLTLGLANDLRMILSQFGSFLEHQEQWLAQLRIRHPAAVAVIDDLEPMQEEAASALMLARMSGGRLLAALEETNSDVIDVAGVVYEVVGLVEPTTREQNVDVLVAVQPSSDPLIRGRRSEIRQLVQGLINDGIEACTRTDKPGKQAVHPAQMPIISVTVTREKNKISLVVEHSGKGFSTEHRHATSLDVPVVKEPLGLMLARNIVAGHGGSLEMSLSDLGGTLVRVVLPAAPMPAKRSAAPPSRRSRPSIPIMEPPPMTIRDGWTSSPTALVSGPARPIRAPAPGGAPPSSEIDTK